MRIFGMIYSIVTYLIGVGALFWVFLAAGGLVPYGISEYRAGSNFMSMLINLLLVLVFAVQHTIMARKKFKEWWIVPSHLERSTFVLFTGIIMSAIMWYWQPVAGAAIWTIESSIGRMAMYGVYFVGIAYVLGTSLATNHFELFGLRQAYLNFKGQEYTLLEFKKHWMYRYSRHPMMLGILMIFWFTPDMTATRLTLALLFTIYIFIGIKFEEVELVKEFGEKYKSYQKEIGLFFTFK